MRDQDEERTAPRKASALIGNKIARSEQHHAAKKAKTQAKLKRRMAQKKAETANPALKVERLAKNVPRTVENSKTWVGMNEEGEIMDPRTVPVKVLQDDATGDYKLDMAGLEDLFPDEDQLTLGPGKSATAASAVPSAPTNTEQANVDAQTEQPEASTSALPAQDEESLANVLSLEQGPVLITTAPRPTKATFAFLDELQSLFGGKKYAHIVPRANARFQLSRVCAWAAKRGYRALLVVGEDHKNPSRLRFGYSTREANCIWIGSVTLTKLPVGPTAHFRLTSIQATKQISGHAAPTSHAPELVLSNMSTPLGLSVGRLLQTLFPPLPQLEGRQVVAVHNQRDFIFFRRFRYMFDLRADNEFSKKWAKDRGMDELVKTRMQEIGPRLTLKLRWIKKGTLTEGRRRAGGQIIGGKQKEKVDDDEDEQRPQSDGEAEAVIDQDAAEQLEEDERVLKTTAPSSNPPKSIQKEQSQTEPIEEAASTDKPIANIPRKKRHHPKTHAMKDGGIRIPKLSIPAESLASEQRSGGVHRIKKRKAGASILDGISFQGGMSDSSKTWAWQVSLLYCLLYAC